MYNECIFFKVILDSKGPKENKHVSSPGGRKDGLKNCKTQGAERLGDYYSISQ